MANPRWRLRAGGDATAIWAAKIAFCFLGVLFVGAAARAAVPAAAGALASSLPVLRAAILSWIRPPYLFIAVHFIIFVIWKLSDQRPQREQRAAEEFGDPDSSRSSSINRKPSPAEVSSPDLAESSQSDASCLTVDSVERSTASSRSSIKRSTEPESDRGTIMEEEEDLAAALAIAGVENDSMEATWKAIKEKPSRAAAASPSPLRLDYRRLNPPPPPAGHDEMTQRFDEFIKKNHQQIRRPTSRRR